MGLSCSDFPNYEKFLGSLEQTFAQQAKGKFFGIGKGKQASLGKTKTADPHDIVWNRQAKDWVEMG